eukprot:1195424-Prorocentrum_minimum.AAC.2
MACRPLSVRAAVSHRLSRVKPVSRERGSGWAASSQPARRNNEYSHTGPIRCRKHGYIPTPDQSDAGSVGIFPRWTKQTVSMMVRGSITNALLPVQGYSLNPPSGSKAKGRAVGESGKLDTPRVRKRKGLCWGVESTLAVIGTLEDP